MPNDLERLDQDIEAIRQVLATLPTDSPDRARRLADLAQKYAFRFRASNDLADLDASITYLRDSLAALAPGHPGRERLLRTLLESMQTRYARTADPADQEAAESYRRAADAEAVEDRRRMEQTEVDRAARPAAPAPAYEQYIDEERDMDWAPRGAAPPPAPAPVPPPAPVQPMPAAPPKPAPGGMPDVLGRSAAPPPAPFGAPSAAPPRKSTEDRRLEFAAAYRRAIERERRHPFLFYVHRPADRDQVRALIERRAPLLGGEPSVSRGQAAQAVRSGTTLTIVPNVLGATFEPSRLEVVVGDSVRELTFQMSVPRETAPGPIDGHIDIFVGPLIIGQVPVAFEVQAETAPTVPKQPGVSELLEVANASIFDRIFVSYSHKDSQVVDLCVATYHGLGVQVLLDKLDLRAGDEWRAKLTRMINDADVFQLYWSVAASASNEVQHEWHLALDLSKSRARSFIRPLYWETPMPPLPQALGHLHFSKLDLKQLRRAAKAYTPAPQGLLRRALAALRPG